uniref:Uncharacterized protein n=1 Tax=Rhipicephalus zambeziensis TaxID=60191 RepID=A0A224YI88_9ACAR
MKTAVVLVLAACFVAAAMSVGGIHRTHSTRESFNEWRQCMVGKLPANKTSVYEGCHNSSRGTDMRKFREGLVCVLDSYNLVERNNVNLTRMRELAQNIQEPELKTAFEDCPKEERNNKLARTVKCVIDSLETSCPLPSDAPRE